jgi:hypothetical protein
MGRLLAPRTALVAAIAVVLVTGTRSSTRAAASDASERPKQKSHGPCRRGHQRSPGRRESSTRMPTDTQSFCGKGPMASLVCQETPNAIGDPAMCADGPSMQWFADFAAHQPKPTNTVPGITYMLAGATDTSRYRSLHHVVRDPLRVHAHHGESRRKAIAINTMW